MRENKNAPQELSAKKPVSRLRTIVESTGPKPRDPRFDPLCGHFNQGLFDKAYEFIDDYRKSEVEMITNELKTTTHDNTDAEKRKSNLHKSLHRIESQLDAEQKRRTNQQLKREWRRQETELIKQGKRPFYLSRKQEKQMQLVDKFRKTAPEMRGQTVEKHRKKLHSRSLKKIPFSSRTTERKE